jgi:hypothetical protein
MAASLREDINNLVVQRVTRSLVTGEKINVPDWVSDMTASLAEIILEQSEEEQPRLVAHAHRTLDDFISARPPSK